MYSSTVLPISLFLPCFQMEIPKFNQLKLLYPGWKHHDGDYNDRDVLTLIGAQNTQDFEHAHNTASLRMSYALNRYGGRHSLGDTPVYLSQVSRDSFTGKDGHEYIYRNTAFGPYLALKYGNPVVIRIDAAHDAAETMRAFRAKQGIVRFVSYHTDHAGGHIALWDCEHFHQSRDWTTERNIIAVEFWETPGEAVTSSLILCVHNSVVFSLGFRSFFLLKSCWLFTLTHVFPT